MKSVIVGTAGHIDHGKTALVKALTGIDADRLEEEKRRGITIDLGFAHLELSAPDGSPLHLGFVDVPGHERFVRNMLAGVGGIDVVLFVIAADESIKPQTREHFDICRLLNISRGITVLTKRDLVDRDTLEVVRLEVEDFLRGSFLDPVRAPVIPVSALTGQGIPELKQALARLAAAATQKDAAALFRLPIDRVFVMKGFGTVVTGTLVAGSVGKEEEVEVFPIGRRVRVRGLQVHGQAAERALAGERTALNLAGVAKENLSRGMTLAPPGLLRAVQHADVSLSLLPNARPLRERSRVHLHVYSAETVAEVVLHESQQLAPGATAFARLRLADPVVLLPGDRFILRQFSPVITIGGGVVLDAAPARKAPKDLATYLDTLARGVPAEMLAARVARRGPAGLTLADAAAETGWRFREVDSAASDLSTKHLLVRLADILLDPTAFRTAGETVLAAVGAFHRDNPLAPGVSKEELREKTRLTPAVLAGILEQLVRENKLEVSGEQVRLPGRGVVLSDAEAAARRTIEGAFASAGLKVPALKQVLASLPVDYARAQKIVTLLLRDKVLVKLADDLVFHRDALAELKQKIADYKRSAAKIDVGKFKDLTGISRKYAIPLLEYLDRERVTRRVGDERVIL